MTTLFVECPDATQGTQFWSSVTGSVTYDTTAGVKKSGLASWKCDSGAGNASAYVTRTVTGIKRAGAYFCLSQFPDVQIKILGIPFFLQCVHPK